jgi:hypothetical protein
MADCRALSPIPMRNDCSNLIDYGKGGCQFCRQSLKVLPKERSNIIADVAIIG